MLRLVTLPISHYCEKARWALDRAGLPYREERHVQVLHAVAARRAGGGRTVPVLVTPDGAIGESSAIVAWADARLPPDRRLLPQSPAERKEVDALCERLDQQLGPSGRRLIYALMLRQPDQMLAFNNTGVPAWEDRTMRVGFPVLTWLVKRVLKIRPGGEVPDEAEVMREFDAVAERLSDGRPYLCGERFGAADLTFAALSAPVTAPPQYGTPLPPLDALLPGTRRVMERFRAHPAGQFALRMYAEERPPPVVTAR